MDQSEAQSRTESVWKLLRVYFKETPVRVLKKETTACVCVTSGFGRCANEIFSLLG
jgi:hypothetical protein